MCTLGRSVDRGGSRQHFGGWHLDHEAYKIKQEKLISNNLNVHADIHGTSYIYRGP